jgi:hypothetical protein
MFVLIAHELSAVSDQLSAFLTLSPQHVQLSTSES